MVQYKLTVANNGDGSYSVKKYHKAAMERKDGLSDVVKYISKLEKKVLMANPSYIGIKREEVDLLEMLRRILLKAN